MNKGREEPQEITRMIPVGNRIYCEGPVKKTERGLVVEWEFIPKPLEIKPQNKLTPPEQ